MDLLRSIVVEVSLQWMVMAKPHSVCLLPSINLFGNRGYRKVADGFEVSSIKFEVPSTISTYQPCYDMM